MIADHAPVGSFNIPHIPLAVEISMSRKFFLATLALLLSLAAPGFRVGVWAQDLDDVDMFGDKGKKDKTEQPTGDPLGLGNLGDFGGPSGTETTEEVEPSPMQQLEAELQKIRDLAESGKCGEAIAAANQILAMNPSLAPVHFLKANCLAEFKEYQMAIASYDQAIRYGAGFPGVVEQANVAKGDILMELNPPQYQDAATAYSDAVQINPINPAYLLKRSKAQIRVASSGMDLNAELTVEQAINSLDRVIAEEDSNAEAHMERSRAYALTREWEKAIDDADRAVSLDPESSDYAARRGIVYLSRAQSERLRPDADMEQVVRDLQVAINSFDRYLDAEGKKTKEDFEDAGPDDFRPDQIWVAAAITQVEMASQLTADQGASYYRDAIANCDRAIEFEPDGANAYVQRGIAERNLGDLRQAIESWDTALKLGSDQGPELRLRRGIARYYLGDLRAARQEFEEARTGAFDGRALFWIGVTYAREGAFNDAIQNYSASLRINPEYRPAYLNRGHVYMQLGDYARAEQDYNQLVLRDSEDEVARQRRDQARQQRQALRIPPSKYYP